MIRVGDYVKVTSDVSYWDYRFLDYNDLILGKVVDLITYTKARVRVVNDKINTQIGNEEFIRIKHLVVVDENGMEIPDDKRQATCANCGEKMSISRLEKASNGRYVCQHCAGVENLGWDNNRKIHVPSPSHKTYGFELESVPRSNPDYLSMINSKYRIIPTYDCTLPTGGIEFKTPTYNGARGLRKLFKSFDKYIDCSDSRCGQHINIGDSEYIKNLYDVRKIRSHYSALDRLAMYMERHTTDTIRVCGRTFTEWAQNRDYVSHSSWINTNNNNRVEFRLSKFVTPEQYYELTIMWTEMLDIMIDAWIKPTKPILTDTQVGDILIDIFKKYADGHAKCQRYTKAIKVA